MVDGPRLPAVLMKDTPVSTSYNSVITAATLTQVHHQMSLVCCLYLVIVDYLLTPCY